MSFHTLADETIVLSSRHRRCGSDATATWRRRPCFPVTRRLFWMPPCGWRRTSARDICAASKVPTSSTYQTSSNRGAPPTMRARTRKSFTCARAIGAARSSTVRVRARHHVCFLFKPWLAHFCVFSAFARFMIRRVPEQRLGKRPSRNLRATLRVLDGAGRGERGRRTRRVGAAVCLIT